MSQTEAPTQPAESAQASKSEAGMPTESPEIDIQSSQSAVGKPTLAPPDPTGVSTQSDSGITAAIWHNNKLVTRVFHGGQNNIWIALEGVGWRKLNSANESAAGAMSLIASHAVDNALTVRAHESDAGLIDEIYCF